MSEELTLEKFFNNLDEFFLSDIKSFEENCKSIDEIYNDYRTTSQEGKNILIKIPTPPKLTIPITLSLFGVADILGYLSRNEIYAKETDTTDNLKEIFKGLDGLKGKNLERFINVYRHGMVHSFFPKYKLEIAYFSKDPDDKLFIKTNDGFYLNVKCLIKYLKQKLDEIKSKSIDNECMKKKYKCLMCNYELKSEGLIQNLKF